MVNWARSSHRRHGVQRVSDCHQNVFISSPTTIDLCPCAGHTMPGKSADSHVLSGHKNDKAGEFLIEIYLAVGTGVTGQFGGVLWCALEYQTCIEIENHNQPASDNNTYGLRRGRRTSAPLRCSGPGRSTISIGAAYFQRCQSCDPERSARSASLPAIKRQ